MLYSCGLALLETIFIFVGLLILHGLRKLVGSAAFYMALGLLLLFAQLTAAAGLKLITGYSGADFLIASTVMFLPYLTIIMVVYVADGTLVAQKLIIGAMASFGFYLYLSSITQMQCGWLGYTIIQGQLSETFGKLLSESMHMMGASIVAQGIDLFLIPIFYQRLRNLNCRLFICVLGSMMLVQIIDSVIFSTIFLWGTTQWWAGMGSSFLVRSLLTIVLSVIATVYLARIEYESPGESRRTLDIIFAFFGSYGRAKALEQNLRESEERYRILVQKASDMIIVMNKKGEVIDANRAALKMLCVANVREIAGKTFEFITGVKHDVWAPLFRNSALVTGVTSVDNSPIIQCSAVIPPAKVEVEITISLISFAGSPLLIAFGRDVTERHRIEREREEWRSQAAHRQRLEAIGRLAGGIAHDFNNYLHAIQGHLDIIKYMHHISDENITRNLGKIDKITEQAGVLTSQLLGFARKGIYQEKEFEVHEFVRKTTELFLPTSLSGITFKLVADRESYIIKGDYIQLQQVLLNLMINAKDAMEERPDTEHILTIRISTPRKIRLKLSPPHDLKVKDISEYCIIRVEDNGPGISSAIKSRIFEPFFTTKPVGKGTGMGLAMAYGTIMAHNGWIQCENIPGSGAAFDVILPLAHPADSTETQPMKKMTELDEDTERVDVTDEL